MIELHDRLDCSTPQEFSILGSPPLNDWINPIGSHFLFGESLHVDSSSGLLLNPIGFCAFSSPTRYKLLGFKNLLIVETPNYLASTQFSLVNHNEPGRLQYIDGCSNTNVIAPAHNGDPCINYLFIPRGTYQSPHVHPSARVILIASGSGYAKFWPAVQSDAQMMPLLAGMKIYLAAGEKHCFVTDTENLSVMVFHPDSDGGPLDRVNPMYSRTYIRPSL